MVSAMKFVGGGRGIPAGTIGFYFHDGADYVPGLDCGHASVWFAEPDDEMFWGHYAISYYSPRDISRDWEMIPDDVPLVSATSPAWGLLYGERGPLRRVDECRRIL